MLNIINAKLHCIVLHISSWLRRDPGGRLLMCTIGIGVSYSIGRVSFMVSGRPPNERSRAGSGNGDPSLAIPIYMKANINN